MENEKRLIDANVRIEEIKKAHCTGCENYGGVRCRACWVDDAIGLIDDAPTVDAVEVVHGQWLDGYAVDHNGKKVYDSIDCSHCNDIFKIETEDRDYWKNRFKVCPFCGAKMDGGNEDG